MRFFDSRSTKVGIYTPAELGTMFAAVATRRPELLPWLACAAYTGARVSEIDHLAWENISFDRNFVEIESSKGGPRLVGWFLCRRR